MWRGIIFLYLLFIFGGKETMALTLTSPAFFHEGEIPAQYTCDGEDLFPGLQWSDIPQGTKTFVLICDDPDVPEALIDKVPDLTWDHLVVFNIPASIQNLPQGRFQCPLDATCGTNSWIRQDYGGPCPPNPKHHRYFFKLYALDIRLNLNSSARKKDVLQAMKGHILGEAILMGRYMRQQFK